MATIEEILTVLNNSKQVNELPELSGIASGDLVAVWKAANDRLEYYPATSLTNQSFSFSINAISLGVGTSVALNKLDVEYSGSAVTKILFDSVFTQYLQGFSALTADYTFVLQLYNSTKLKTHIAEITSIAYSDGTNTHSLVELKNTIDPTSFAVNDVLQVQISVAKKQLNEKIYIEGNAFDYVPIVGNDGSTFQAGDFALNGRRSSTIFWDKARYVSGDAALFASWEVMDRTI